MRRHRFDPFSFVFGGLFVGLSLFVLLGGSLGDLGGMWSWIVPTLVVGALVVGYAVRAAVSHPATATHVDDDTDEGSITSNPADAEP